MVRPALCIILASLGTPADPGARAEPADEVGSRVYVHKDANTPGLFIPSGVMPDGTGVSQNIAEADRPHDGKDCIRIKCELSAKDWVGVYFLLSGKWEPSQPFDLLDRLGASKGDPIRCRFWARSADSAVVQFKVGGVLVGGVRDSLKYPSSSEWVKLTPEWKMYEIDLTGDDLSSLVGGFMWAADRAHNGDRDVTIDLDSIYFTVVKDR
jgi:hypothetical protein